MISKKMFRTFALGAVAFCLIGIGSNSVYAQEAQPVAVAQGQVQQDSWETWKADMKTRFQQMKDGADKIKTDAQAKKITDANFKTALDNFDASAKAFASKWGTVDQVAADQRDQFKKDATAAFDKLKTSYEALKTQWDALNKK